MWYLIEEYKWDKEGELQYYHLVDSKIVRSTKIQNNEHKDGSLFEVTKLENYEVEGTRSRKRRHE